jgi:hypothetical protein
MLFKSCFVGFHLFQFLLLGLFHDKCGAFNSTHAVEVWEKVQVLEGFFSFKLSNLTQEHLLSSNQLDMAVSTASESNEKLLELYSAPSCILLL